MTSAEGGLSPAELEWPSGPFLEAVGAGALTATAIWGAGFWFNRAEIAAPPLIIIFLFLPILAALVTAATAAVVGLPLTWLLARNRCETPWAYPMAGLVAGSAMTLAFLSIGPGGAWRLPAEWLRIAASGALPGFACGALWWLRYRRHLQAEAGE